MADFIDRVSPSTRQNPAPYLRNAILEHFLPELLADINPEPPYFLPNWLDGKLGRALRSRLHDGSPELYIGGSGAKFPFLHFDSYHTHAFLAQIYGTKEYTAFSADQTPYIYVSPKQYNASQILDIENPDLNQFPLRANASNWAKLTHDMCRNAPLHMKPIAAAYLTGLRAYRTLSGS